MNFLKKIFGDRATERVRVPRAARVELSPLHRISFQLTSENRPLQIGNISATGIGLIIPEGRSWKLLETLIGGLQIGEKKFAIQARICHLGQLLAGCQFLGEDLSFRREIENYLRVEILALSLNKVDERYLKPDPRGRVIWYSDAKQNEVFCICDDEGIVSFHLGFLGHYVEGGRGQLTRMARLLETRRRSPGDIEETKAGHKSSTLLDFAKRFDPEIQKLAITLVRNVENMPPVLRDALIADLEKSDLR